MCGTAAVSAAFRKAGYQVIASDIMTYAYHHAQVTLGFTQPPQFKGAEEFLSKFAGRPSTLLPQSRYEAVIHALNNVPSKKGFFWREFSNEGKPVTGVPPRNYFSPENAAKIDGLRYWIKKLHLDGCLTDLEHSLLLHDLIMGANDIANIAGTYGHYLSKLIPRAKQPIKLHTSALLILDDKKAHHEAKCGRAEDLAAGIKCDLCYIDPPYMKRQYAANYHLLETLAREDEPDAIGISGLRQWRDQYSNFCTKTRIRDSFRIIFNDMKTNDFLISYSEDGLLKLHELEVLMEEFGKVVTHKLTHKRFKSNESKLAPDITEYLIHLRRRYSSYDFHFYPLWV